VPATLFERALDPLGPDKLMGAKPSPQTFRTPMSAGGAGEISEPVITLHDN
jgi:hypothetical protein